MSTAIVVAIISGVVSLAAAAISLVSARSVARPNGQSAGGRASRMSVRPVIAAWRIS